MADLSSVVARFPVRSLDLTRLLDTVLVCAVGTILVVRTQLWLTNYPQLGGHGLHIAHLLWGGLLMLLALALLLAFISPLARELAAVVGGIGLGLFMDELGKFVTADNNYFFKPTAALIYIFFVGFYLVVRQLGRRTLSPRESLLNAIELSKSAALGELDEGRRRRALTLLDRADEADPVAAGLRVVLEEMPRRPTRSAALATRLADRARKASLGLVEQPWFARALVGFFSVWAAASLLQIAAVLVLADTGLSRAEVFRIGRAITNDPLGEGELDFLQWTVLATSLVATAFVLLGLYRYRQGHRAGAFAAFERALLVSLFFTQVFAFVYSQFFAVFGFCIDLLLFVAVRAIVSRELGRAPSG